MAVKKGAPLFCPGRSPLGFLSRHGRLALRLALGCSPMARRRLRRRHASPPPHGRRARALSPRRGVPALLSLKEVRQKLTIVPECIPLRRVFSPPGMSALTAPSHLVASGSAPAAATPRKPAADRGAEHPTRRVVGRCALLLLLLPVRTLPCRDSLQVGARIAAAFAAALPPAIAIPAVQPLADPLHL
eukprot:scaffold12129_cov89-Isochrysis_galbana.AAC.3